MKDKKVLAFDTGGTVLDWHTGLTAAMTEWGGAHVIERDWHAMANEHGRRSLRWMTNTIDPAFNIETSTATCSTNYSTRTRLAVRQKEAGGKARPHHGWFERHRLSDRRERFP